MEKYRFENNRAERKKRKMSQEKVDRYKKEKANRKQILKREKRMHYLEMTGLVLVCVLVLGWFGFSVYQKGQTNKETETVEKHVTEIDVGAIQEYMTGLTPAEGEE